MDRFSSIMGVNQKYANRDISNAIASNVLPITFSSALGDQVNQMNFSNAPNNLQNQRVTTNLPISIADAQREVSPFYGYSRMTGAHQSRIGEVMYEDGGKKRIRTDLQSSSPVPRFLACLLPGILLLFLFIFVFTCIWNHRNHPLSVNGLKYYLHHPDQVKDPNLTAAILLANSDQRNFQDQQKESQQLDENGNPILLDGVESEVPLVGGTCRQGLHYLHGLCYPCKIGYWNGSKCTTELPKVQNTTVSTTTKISTPTVPTTVSKTNSVIQQKIDKFNQDFVDQLNSSNNSTFQNNNSKCKQNQILSNGKCISCPEGLTWNGQACERPASHHFDISKIKTHLKHKVVDTL